MQNRVKNVVQHISVLEKNQQSWCQHNVVIETAMGASLEYIHLNIGSTQSIFSNSLLNEIGHLAQGLGTWTSQGTNTILFIPKSKVTEGIIFTYGRIVAEIWPQKHEIHRTQVTAGVNLIEFPGDVTIPTADITTSKILLKRIL